MNLGSKPDWSANQHKPEPKNPAGFFSNHPLTHRFVSTAEKSYDQFAFPKGSPLLPFFRHAYTKIRQTGAFHRHSKKWRTEDQSIGCDSTNALTPISFNKIVSLVAVLLLGIFLALITLVFEKMYLQKITAKRMEWNIE